MPILAAPESPYMAAFRQRIEAQGGVVIEVMWLGATTGHRCLCSTGHKCSPTPSGIKMGKGLCKICAGRDPESSYQRFKNRLIELGATLLEDKWLGVHAPHKAKCINDHLCSPTPTSVNRGNGICRTCTNLDPETAMRDFISRLADNGAVLLEQRWFGAAKPHQIRCKNNHTTYTYPNNVKRGQGICRYCAGRNWDVLYIVASDEFSKLKFGITSGDSNPRLTDHKRQGYNRIIRVYEDLPDTMALELESNIKELLSSQGYSPTQGKEYFDIDSLPIILQYVDTCMGIEKN